MEMIKLWNTNVYLIDTSADYNRTGKARYEIEYSQVVYPYKGK